jgi:hypothetical protein
MTIKLEIIRQALNPAENATSAGLISEFRSDTIKAAALAQVDPAEWEEVSDRMSSALTVKSN